LRLGVCRRWQPGADSVEFRPWCAAETRAPLRIGLGDRRNSLRARPSVFRRSLHRRVVQNRALCRYPYAIEPFCPAPYFPWGKVDDIQTLVRLDPLASTRPVLSTQNGLGFSFRATCYRYSAPISRRHSFRLEGLLTGQPVESGLQDKNDS